MHPIVFFDSIIIETPREKIYRRLGYRKGVTALPASREAEVERHISEALVKISLRGVGLRIALSGKNDSQVILAGEEGRETLKSRRLAGFFSGCSEALLMGATAGSEVVRAIEEDTAGNRLTRGVVFDAAASEMVDASLDWIMSYFAGQLRRENKVLTEKRFSAGYGDFHLENQGIMFRLLELEKIGVQITKSLVLIPEKSVTAVAGVKGI